MRLGSVRDLMGIAPVLMNPSAPGPDPVYYVFNNVTEGGPWANITIMTAGKYGKEYPKTFGHYHGAQVLETYHILSGEGVMQLQKRFMDQKMWVAEKVMEVLLVRVNAGEEITIGPEYGHSWSNVGELPFITYDNWTAGHEPTDYAMIEKLGGLAYYLIDGGGKVKAVANPKYQDLPEPVWMNAEEFKNKNKA